MCLARAHCSGFGRMLCNPTLLPTYPTYRATMRREREREASSASLPTRRKGNHTAVQQWNDDDEWSTEARRDRSDDRLGPWLSSVHWSTRYMAQGLFRAVPSRVGKGPRRARPKRPGNAGTGTVGGRAAGSSVHGSASGEMRSSQDCLHRRRHGRI